MILNRLSAMVLAFGVIFGFLAIMIFSGTPVSEGKAKASVSCEQPTPTLAPPREEFFAQQGGRKAVSTKGEAVFLFLETDGGEVEFSWATP
jgi:hypothetical protein